MIRFAALCAAVLVAAALLHSATAALRPPHYQLWMCVHQHEHSAWNDPNAPYYGGLQMGSWFMRTYGARLLRAKGTADRWTPLEQMWVAENAYKRERYSTAWFNTQWPPSAGRCGL